MVNKICFLKAKNINRLEKLLDKIILNPELCKDESGEYQINIIGHDYATKERVNSILDSYYSNLDKKIDKLYQKVKRKSDILRLLFYTGLSNMAFSLFLIAATGFVATANGAPATNTSPQRLFDDETLTITLLAGSFIGYLLWETKQEEKEFDKELYETLYYRAKYLIKNLKIKYC